VNPAGGWILFIETQCRFRGTDRLAVASQTIEVIGFDHHVAYIGGVEFQHMLDGDGGLVETAKAAQRAGVTIPGEQAFGR